MTPFVIDADHRCAASADICNQALLHGGIIFQRAVAIEMIFRDVEQNANRRIERRREVDLIG